MIILQKEEWSPMISILDSPLSWERPLSQSLG
jgi:hypothetical protein